MAGGLSASRRRCGNGDTNSWEGNVMQKCHKNRLFTESNAKLIVDGELIDCAPSELRNGRTALSGLVAAGHGANDIACIAEVGALAGHVTEVGNGAIMIEFGTMVVAAAVRLSERAARTYWRLLGGIRLGRSCACGKPGLRR